LIDKTYVAHFLQ